jgi:hypothetical protein
MKRSGMTIILAIGIWLALQIYLTVVCVQKGKPWFAGLGWVIGWLLLGECWPCLTHRGRSRAGCTS